MSRKPDWAKIAFDFHRHRESLQESLPGLNVWFSLDDYGYGHAMYTVNLRSETPKIEISERHEDLNKAVSNAMTKLRKWAHQAAPPAAAGRPTENPRHVTLTLPGLEVPKLRGAKL